MMFKEKFTHARPTTYEDRSQSLTLSIQLRRANIRDKKEHTIFMIGKERPNALFLS